MKRPFILQRPTVSRMDERPTSNVSATPISSPRSGSKRKPVVSAKLLLDGNHDQRMNFFNLESGPLRDEKHVTRSLLSFQNRLPGFARRLRNRTPPETVETSSGGLHPPEQSSAATTSIPASNFCARSRSARMLTRKRKPSLPHFGTNTPSNPTNSETPLRDKQFRLENFEIFPVPSTGESNAIPASLSNGEQVQERLESTARATQLNITINASGNQSRLSNTDTEPLHVSTTENQVIVVVDEDFNIVNLAPLAAEPTQGLTERTVRHREASARTYDRLIRGLVELPPEAIRGSFTLETGNRTRAHAICNHIYSRREDWLNEPGLRLMDFFHLMRDDVRLLCWLARRRLIPNQLKCNKGGCTDPLYLTRDVSSQDGWSWRCDTCQNKRSIRYRSIFTHCDLTIRTATQILYLWSVGHPSELIAYDTDTSVQDTNDWLYCIREVCRETNSELKELIGGVEEDGEAAGYCRVVEIDERMFTCWVNDSQLGLTMKNLWLIGGVERGTERSFLARCPRNNRDAFSLIPIIREYVKPGTAVITDDWEGYTPLGQLPDGYLHYVTDRGRVARDSEKGAIHIQKITGQWSHWKRHFESLNGTKVEEFETRLDEYLWRMRHSKAILQSFCYSVTLLFEV